MVDTEMRQKKIAIIYHSQSRGNTAAAADKVADGVREHGEFEPELHNTNDGRVAPAVLSECAAAAFGTPDYFSYPAGGMKMFIDDWLIAKRGGQEGLEGLPVALFVTHGGGMKAVEPFEYLFTKVGPQVGETVSVAGAPADEDADRCRELGRRLAEQAETFLREEGDDS